MIISWQSTLGRGTSKTSDLPEAEQDRHQRLNFVGHPEVTRFLSFCALRETYANDPDVLTDALRHIVLNFQHGLRDGIEVVYRGEKFRLRLCCLVTKGDWPCLIEAGGLTRHFRRAAKKSEAKTVPNAGLCHFCLAGTEGVPCSDTSDTAAWIQTMGSAAASFAWDVESPITLGLVKNPAEPAMLFRPDLFHNWHLGMGQCFVGSTLVLLSSMCPGSSIPKRFEELTQLWRSWCKSKWLGL